MNIADLANARNLANFTSNVLKNAIAQGNISSVLPISFDVLKKLADGGYLINIDGKQIEAASAKELIAGAKYWAQVIQKDNLSTLINAIKKPDVLQFASKYQALEPVNIEKMVHVLTDEPLLQNIKTSPNETTQNKPLQPNVQKEPAKTKTEEPQKTSVKEAAKEVASEIIKETKAQILQEKAMPQSAPLNKQVATQTLEPQTQNQAQNAKQTAQEHKTEHKHHTHDVPQPKAQEAKIVQKHELFSDTHKQPIRSDGAHIQKQAAQNMQEIKRQEPKIEAKNEQPKTQEMQKEQVRVQINSSQAQTVLKEMPKPEEATKKDEIKHKEQHKEPQKEQIRQVTDNTQASATNVLQEKTMQKQQIIENIIDKQNEKLHEATRQEDIKEQVHVLAQSPLIFAQSDFIVQDTLTAAFEILFGTLKPQELNTQEEKAKIQTKDEASALSLFDEEQANSAQEAQNSPLEQAKDTPKDTPLNRIKQMVLEEMANASSKQDFMILSNVALALNRQVVSMIVEDEEKKRALMQFRKKNQSDALKQSVEFYSAFEVLGPIAGEITLASGELFLKLDCEFETTAKFLQSKLDELKGFDTAKVSIIQAKANELFTLSASLLDIQG